jgi:hypothetical protein
MSSFVTKNPNENYKNERNKPFNRVFVLFVDFLCKKKN